MYKRRISSLIFSRDKLFLLVYKPILAELSKKLDSFLDIWLAHKHVPILVENPQMELNLLYFHFLILRFLYFSYVDKIHVFCLFDIWLDM